jgi:hypothetical protein
MEFDQHLEPKVHQEMFLGDCLYRSPDTPFPAALFVEKLYAIRIAKQGYVFRFDTMMSCRNHISLFRGDISCQS